MTSSPHRHLLAATTVLALLTSGVATATATATATTSAAHPSQRPPHDRCAPSARAVGYSDALDKATYQGTQIGGLSSLAYDARSHAWVSAVDNNKDDPSRIWTFRNLAKPRVVRAPLVLKKPDGTPYTGLTADNEGLAVLPNGDFLVSSETEPSIRIFGRDGVEKASLPIPARFAVTGRSPQGEATNNATLEGLTLSRDGRTIVASMEGPLSGDTTATDKTAHRFLVYRKHDGGWNLQKEIGYRTDDGNRIPEVQFYGRDNLLVEEAAWSASAGNSVKLYAVTGEHRAKDVSAVNTLSAAPASSFVRKSLVADLATCPTLGAPAKETQTNPLLDNDEGMAVTGGFHGLYGVSLISDDNFSPKQTTRILNLVARLPR